jgi:hypothetical protein
MARAVRDLLRQEWKLRDVAELIGVRESEVLALLREDDSAAVS